MNQKMTFLSRFRMFNLLENAMQLLPNAFFTVGKSGTASY